MRYLFIGGEADGRRLELPELRPAFRVLVREPVTFGLSSPPDEYVPIKTDEYRPMKFCGDKRFFHVYVLRGLTADDVVDKLIENYKEKRHGETDNA